MTRMLVEVRGKDLCIMPTEHGKKMSLTLRAFGFCVVCTMHLLCCRVTDDLDSSNGVQQ